MNRIASTDISPAGPTVDLYARRTKIQARAVSGYFQRLRRLTMVAVLALFGGLPWLQWNGRQALLFDLPGRHFHIFGWTFQPQDFIYLSWLLMIAAFALFTLTVFAGRVYCGYACPQTVWTEIFQLIERFAEGDRNARIRLDKSPLSVNKIMRRGAKHAGWILVSLATGVAFIGYFSPVRQLVHDLWLLQLSFWEIFWVLFFTTLTYLNAGWMREQVCMYMCPYGRFQSVMIDKDTLIISYDAAAGEPRGSRKRGADPKTLGLGDCVDCDICVQVCPTGIDIREGLQFQCIQCAACVDACDGVMKQMGYPSGLVRYTSEHSLETGKPLHLLRPRLLGYATLILLVSSVFMYSLGTRIPLTVEAIHDRNQLYRESGEGTIENSYLVKVMNESQARTTYQIAVEGDPAIHFENTIHHHLTLNPGEMVNLPVTLEADPAKLPGTHNDIRFRVTEADNAGVQRTVPSRFLAPAVGS